MSVCYGVGMFNTLRNLADTALRAPAEFVSELIDDAAEVFTAPDADRTERRERRAERLR